MNVYLCYLLRTFSEFYCVFLFLLICDDPISWRLPQVLLRIGFYAEVSVRPIFMG
jgi:hypothetical protein